MIELLLTRPSYEITTKYLYAWNEKVIGKARIKKVKTTDLAKEKATRKNLTSALSQNNPNLVFLNGHGASNAIAGQDDEILIQAGINEDILRNRHVHAFSCETGKELGPSAIAKGAKSYIGYKEPFVFITTKGKEVKPLTDKRASYFLDPAIVVSLSLLDSNSPKKAQKNSQKAFLKNIQTLAASSNKKRYLIRYLFWDLKCQVCLERGKKIISVTGLPVRRASYS